MPSVNISVMRTTTRESLNMTTVVFMVAFAQNPLSNGASTVPNLATDNNNLLDYHSFTVLSANDLKKATEELLKRNGTNSAQPLGNESLSTSNTSMEEFPDAEKNPYALIFAVIPVLTIFGNALVILSVFLDRSLQTVTNLLIVSLAISDLMVASCVMSVTVYFQWNSFVWDIGPTLCNLYIGFDVVCSTASILNLVAISIDRYIAISHPLIYCQYGSNQPRAYISIGVVWGVSLAVGLPIFFGANHIEYNDNRGQFCEFTNAYFIICSSILSFFAPCIAMIILYTIVFLRLREREKARLLLQQSKEHKHREGIRNLPPPPLSVSDALINGSRIVQHLGCHFKMESDRLVLEINSSEKTNEESNTLSSKKLHILMNGGTHLKYAKLVNSIPMCKNGAPPQLRKLTRISSLPVSFYRRKKPPTIDRHLSKQAEDRLISSGVVETNSSQIPQKGTTSFNVPVEIDRKNELYSSPTMKKDDCDNSDNVIENGFPVVSKPISPPVVSKPISPFGQNIQGLLRHIDSISEASMLDEIAQFQQKRRRSHPYQLIPPSPLSMNVPSLTVPIPRQNTLDDDRTLSLEEKSNSPIRDLINGEETETFHDEERLLRDRPPSRGVAISPTKSHIPTYLEAFANKNKSAFRPPKTVLESHSRDIQLNPVENGRLIHLCRDRFSSMVCSSIPHRSPNLLRRTPLHLSLNSPSSFNLSLPNLLTPTSLSSPFDESSFLLKSSSAGTDESTTIMMNSSAGDEWNADRDSTRNYISARRSLVKKTSAKDWNAGLRAKSTRASLWVSHSRILSLIGEIATTIFHRRLIPKKSPAASLESRRTDKSQRSMFPNNISSNNLTVNRQSDSDVTCNDRLGIDAELDSGDTIQGMDDQGSGKGVTARILGSAMATAPRILIHEPAKKRTSPNCIKNGRLLSKRCSTTPSWRSSFTTKNSEAFNRTKTFRSDIEQGQSKTSRRLVKRATRQMRREHKATVTLAVVLG